MLTELILYPFIVLGRFLISLLPTVSLDVAENALDGLSTLSANVGYILPVKGLSEIFVAYLAYLSARVLFSVIIRIKSFIPTMGG